MRVATIFHHHDFWWERSRELAERNFQIAKSEFSFSVLRQRLGKVFSIYGDEIRASRQRLAKSKLRYSV